MKLTGGLAHASVASKKEDSAQAQGRNVSLKIWIDKLKCFAVSSLSLAVGDEMDIPFGWYCVHTQSQRETQVDELLRNLPEGWPGGSERSFQTMLPRIVLEKGKMELAFPRYFFFLVERDGPRWEPIYRTEGVSSIVSIGGRTPSRIPDEIISNFRAAYGPNCILDNRVLVASSDLAGKMVQIGENNRHFGGQTGICTLAKKKRVEVLLDWMGGMRSFSFLREDVTELADG